MALSLLRKFYIFRGVPVVHINIKMDTKTGMAGPEWSPIDEDTERHRTTQWLLEDWMNHPPVHSALLVVFLYLSRTHAFFVDFVLLPAASVRVLFKLLMFLHLNAIGVSAHGLLFRSKILSIVLVGIYWLNWIDLYWSTSTSIAAKFVKNIKYYFTLIYFNTSTTSMTACFRTCISLALELPSKRARRLI